MACLLALPAAALAAPARRSADHASVDTARAAVAHTLGKRVVAELDRTLYTRAEHVANAAQVGEFRGGDIVVISVTVGTLVLVGVIVLLIILLT